MTFWHPHNLRVRLDERKPTAAEFYCGSFCSRDYFAIQPALSTTDIAANLVFERCPAKLRIKPTNSSCLF